MAQHIVAISNAFPRNSSKVNNPYAFLDDLISILREPSVTFKISIPEQHIGEQAASSSEFHVEVPPQNLRKITDAVTKAEALQKKAETSANTDVLTSLNQTNKEISERITQAVPAMVLLAYIEDYCQKHTAALIQREQQRRERIGGAERKAISCLFIGALYAASMSIFFVIRYQNPILLLLMLLPGVCLELAGIYYLRVSAAWRKKLNEMIQRRSALYRFRMIPLIINEITDQQKKQAIMQELLISILKYENAFPG